jgi:hypothetical protein
MGKLSSGIGGGWRGRWLVLIVAALLIGDGALAAKARMRDRGDRSNDSSWGNARSDTVARNTDSGSNSGSGSGARTGNASSNDKANDKSAKSNKDDDDDDDARGNQLRDGSKSQNRAAGAGKGNGADAAEPPKTVVEMLQRMFPAGTPGSGDAKPATRSDTGKAADGDKPGKADVGKKDQDPAAPAANRSAPQVSTAQAKRAVQRATQPSLSWLRDAKASDLFRRDEVLVVGASPEAMAQLRFAHVETITTATSSVSRFVVPEGFDAISARQLLREQMPGALSAFNYVYRPYVAAMEGGAGGVGQPIRPSAIGCSAERCYGPSLINWVPDTTSCVIDIGIGVIDTGFDSQHPAFKDRKINWSTVLEGESVSVQAWHGTGVLALLSGHPQSSTPGLIPGAAFTATNTFYADGNGQPATDTTTLIKALKLMDTYKVKVINLSLAGPQDAVLHKHIREMSETGVLFVAAAGNGGPFALPSYPAAYPEVIAVTAVDRNLVGYRHATRGPHIDLAAPGVDIWTALPDKKEGPQTGTSFAVPYVTAAAAAVYPKDELVYRGRPLEPKKAVLSRLTTRDLGPAGRDSIYGQGLLQAPAKCADRTSTPVEVSSAWSPTLQPVVDQVEPLASSGLMSLSPSADVHWPGVVQQLSFQAGR